MPADALAADARSAKIYGPDFPDPDLIFGASRDQRLANFLLRQAADAEFYLLPFASPELTKRRLESASEDDARARRRVGSCQRLVAPVDQGRGHLGSLPTDRT
ncbi:undecaprenyl diphosphate synthase family protein [Methylocystis sp. SC2]|uniref:undecaprenyl diphosphate synthase family protein n=1 Tax=Methylocystis sp. (strain SC2) TaxID=187303 RepID=UPI0009FE17E4